MKSIAEIYFETIEKLKNDQRPRILLTPELLTEIRRVWSEALTSSQLDTLKQVFCLLEHAHASTNEFDDLFLKTLHELRHSPTLIYCLAASRRHVIEESLKTGNMISQDYFEALKKLLKEKNPELKEWTLRTIETLGPLGVRLKAEVLKSRPNIVLGIFNQHQKASAQIIDYLEKQWQRTK